MYSIAIIPARGGSKRIPHKNVRPFLGQPLLSYSIHLAKESGCFDHIFVSTDDPEIASVAHENHIQVLSRPKEFADDFSTIDDVLLFELERLKKQGKQPSFACCLYATAPLLQIAALQKGYHLLKQQQATSALSVTTFPFPIRRALRQNSQNRLELQWPEHRSTRSQDLEEMWHDAGQFVWLDVKKYLLEKRHYCDDMIAVPIPRQYVQDIDTEEDWDRAENMYKLLQIEKSTRKKQES